MGSPWAYSPAGPARMPASGAADNMSDERTIFGHEGYRPTRTANRPCRRSIRQRGDGTIRQSDAPTSHARAFALPFRHERDGERNPAAGGGRPYRRCRGRAAPQARRDADERRVAHAARARARRHRPQTRSDRRAWHCVRARTRWPRGASHAGATRQRARTIRPCGTACAGTDRARCARQRSLVGTRHGRIRNAAQTRSNPRARRAVDIAPAYAAARYNLAAVLADQERSEEALDRGRRGSQARCEAARRLANTDARVDSTRPVRRRGTPVTRVTARRCE